MEYFPIFWTIWNIWIWIWIWISILRDQPKAQQDKVNQWEIAKAPQKGQTGGTGDPARSREPKTRQGWQSSNQQRQGRGPGGESHGKLDSKQLGSSTDPESSARPQGSTCSPPNTHAKVPGTGRAKQLRRWSATLGGHQCFYCGLVRNFGVASALHGYSFHFASFMVFVFLSSTVLIVFCLVLFWCFVSGTVLMFFCIGRRKRFLYFTEHL